MVKSIFLFQRGLRLDDNLALIKCLDNSTTILPVFILDPRQCIPNKNKFFSKWAFGFMHESLKDLNTHLESIGSRLLIIEGLPHKILPMLIKKFDIMNVYCAKDYTPFAKIRESQINAITNLILVNDYLLFNPGDVLNKSGKSYKVYTPFKNTVALLEGKILKPNTVHFYTTGGSKFLKSKLIPKNPTAWKYMEDISIGQPEFPGGRISGMIALQNVGKTQQSYDKCRDYLKFKTSRLSPYIKFGCISIREVWKTFGSLPSASERMLKNQLLWREFYYHMYNANPELLEWDTKVSNLPTNILTTSITPDIVRESLQVLTSTGYLHNRRRMILATYLLHYKKIYWKRCDRFYAKFLVDYDPIVNAGNWLTIVGQPKFKWLKSETQQKKWDKSCPN